MRLCRFRLDDVDLFGFYTEEHVVPIDQAYEAYCESEGDGLVLPAAEELLDLLPPDGRAFRAARVVADWVDDGGVDLETLAIPLEEVQLLVPVARPPKLLLLAGNYAKHVEERGGVAAERERTFPYVFLKPPSTTLTNPCDPIVIPAISPDHIDWECELGIIIGRLCRDVSEDEALEYVAGYTVVNDISDRRFRPNPDRMARDRDTHFDWLHGKWHDTFCPMGPCVLSADAIDDPQALHLRLSVNDEVKQDASTARMIFPVAAIVSFLSSFMTLEPGDVISTGTPSGVGSSTGQYLKPGDVVVAEIEGIGRLENPVVAG